jgi:hypothetical protein
MKKATIIKTITVLASCILIMTMIGCGTGDRSATTETSLDTRTTKEMPADAGSTTETTENAEGTEEETEESDTETGSTEEAEETSQGTPFTTDKTHTVAVGDHTITSEWLQMDEPLVSDSFTSISMEAAGDTIYISDGDAIYRYKYEGDGLTYIDALTADGTGGVDVLSSDTSDKLYIGGFFSTALVVEDGEVTSEINGASDLLMYQDGTWGITTGYHEVVNKVTVSDGTATTTPMELRPEDETDAVFLSEDHIYVFGKNSETGNYAIWVYDLEGNQQTILGNTSPTEADSGYLGYVQGIEETSNGFVEGDQNLRAVQFYDTNGSFIARADSEELFGTPEVGAVYGMSKLSDGSLLAVVVEDRADDSGEEILVYRLTGF